MARPKKNNADYFTHDADMRNDPKIRALRKRYSHMGYAVWSFLLEYLTDCDFFRVEWSELNVELLAADFDVAADELREVVDYCVKLGLLTIEEDKFLTCEKLQERMKPLVEKRIRRNEAKADADNLRSENVEQKEFSEKKPPIKEVSDSQNPQSKVKESKVNNIPPLSLLGGNEPNKTRGETSVPLPDESPAAPGKERKSCAKKKEAIDTSFVEPAFQPIVADWLAYKSERGQTYRQKGFEACYERLLNLSGRDPAIARKVVGQSMANNWAGLFELKRTISHDAGRTDRRTLPDNPVYHSDDDF